MKTIAILLLAAHSYARPAYAQDRPISSLDAQTRLLGHLKKIRSQKFEERNASALALHEELNRPANAGEDPPSGTIRKQLTIDLIMAYEDMKDKDYADPETRRNFIYDVTRFGDNGAGKNFILKILDHGKPEERNAALRGLGSTGIGGAEIYAKIEELEKRSVLTHEAATTYLARIDRDRALSGIIHEVTTTKDKRRFIYSAWALQDNFQRPRDFRIILPRIVEFGLNRPGSFDGKSDGLFWLNPKLLADYVDVATGTDLHLALELMSQNGRLTRPESAPPLIRLLSNPDPSVRILSARALAQVSAYSLADKKTINAELNGAIELEKNPPTKVALLEVVNQIKRADEEYRRAVERYGR